MDGLTIEEARNGEATLKLQQAQPYKSATQRLLPVAMPPGPKDYSPDYQQSR